MTSAMYEVIFEATKTLQNGYERRIRKSVLIPRFDETTGRHTTPEQQIARGTAALEEAHYYQIAYIGTKATTLIFG